MQSGQRRARTFAAAFMFVLGLSTVFLLMGLAASALGRQVLAYRDWLAYGGGVLIMIFGAHFVGVFRTR
jgi:cytochrome c-type biogenesis protein